MQWNEHIRLKGKHAFLSPSNYHWINYTVEKLQATYFNRKKVEEGTALHAFAASAIEKKIKLASRKKALYCFVNDSIGFGMDPEVVLYYSDNCFGTADAIKFDDETMTLRVFDLKTGETEAKFYQLDIYSALFCLEYGYDPRTIRIIERIYQYNGYREYEPDGEYIFNLMETIIKADSVVDRLESNEYV